MIFEEFHYWPSFRLLILPILVYFNVNGILLETYFVFAKVVTRREQVFNL